MQRGTNLEPTEVIVRVLETNSNKQKQKLVL